MDREGEPGPERPGPAEAGQPGHGWPAGGSVNYGIQQSGGISQAGAQAVGPGARASHGEVRAGAQVSGPAELPGLLRAVGRLIEEHEQELADPDAARALTGDLQDELGQAQPDPGRVQRLLTRLAAVVQPVASLGAAVGQIIDAVRAALGS